MRALWVCSLNAGGLLCDACRRLVVVVLLGSPQQPCGVHETAIAHSLSGAARPARVLCPHGRYPSAWPASAWGIGALSQTCLGWLLDARLGLPTLDCPCCSGCLRAAVEQLCALYLPRSRFAGHSNWGTEVARPRSKQSEASLALQRLSKSKGQELAAARRAHRGGLAAGSPQPRTAVQVVEARRVRRRLPDPRLTNPQDGRAHAPRQPPPGQRRRLVDADL